MDDARWQRLQQLFAMALARPQAERKTFVAEACGDDAELAAELSALIRHDDDTASGADAVGRALQQAAGRWLEGHRDARIGTRLGPWRITAHIADGGMGAVYRAERDDGQYRQVAAVKLLNPALVSPQAAARLEAERQILARLSHPLIARLLDGGRADDGTPYLVMEHVDGRPIDAWCDEEALDTAARLRLMVQVCRAVDFAHRNLVVHRDLKPGNILVDADGTPRLLDFGIAKLVDAEGLTRSGEQVLTPSHASPEQLAGGTVTTATDIYALGVLLYELLAGRHPHADPGGSGSSAAALARSIVESEPPRPSAAAAAGSSRRLDAARRRGDALTAERLARELAGDLDNIVLMALRKDPARRYTSAQALADDLERHLARQPVSARADTLAYRTAKFVQRHPVAVPVSALALVLALGGAGFFTWQLAAERDRALAAERTARRSAQFIGSWLEGTGAFRDGEREVSVKELLMKAAARVEKELADEPEVAGRLRTALASALHSWGAYTDAERLLRSALPLLQTVHGTRPHADVADTMSLLGTVWHDLGRLDTGLEWSLRAEVQWRAIGDPKRHARALYDVALALNGLRRRNEAEPLFREALAGLREAHRGADHPDIADLLNNYAWCLHAMGRLDEAAPLYEQSAAMQRRVGANEADLHLTLNNLAGLHGDRGDIATAERLQREVLAMVRRHYGDEGHAAVARSHNAIGVTLLERGLADEAERHIAEALRLNLKLLGEKHRFTAITMQSHGVALLALGRQAEAEQRIGRSLAIRREVLPPRHPDLVGTQLALGRLALARNEPARAERELREALAIIDAMTSPDRVQRDVVEWHLARAVALQGRRDEARALAQSALQRRRSAMPATHHRRIAAEAGIALPPFADSIDAGARAAAERALQQLRATLGPKAPAVRELEAQLAMSPAG